MNQPTIVDDVLGLFRAAGFEVRAPSELDPTGKFAIAGSVDAAGVLMESIIEHFGKTAEVANSCAQRGKCESEKIGAAEKPTGDLTDEQAYLTDASHPRDMQQAMEWITGLRNRIDNLLDAINAQADVEALLPELQVDLLMAESFPRTRPTSAFRSFARAIERAAIAAHLARQPKAKQLTVDLLLDDREAFSQWITTEWRPDDGSALLAKEWPSFAFAAFQAGRKVEQLVRQSQQADEVLSLHRQLATEKLRADQGWQRAEAKSKECVQLRERIALAPASQEGAHAARNAVLEEAALAAEKVQDVYRERQSGKWPELRDDAETGAGDCVAVIRGLKTPASAERSGDGCLGDNDVDGDAAVAAYHGL